MTGSKAADTENSGNYFGVKSPAVDALVTAATSASEQASEGEHESRYEGGERSEDSTRDAAFQRIEGFQRDHGHTFWAVERKDEATLQLTQAVTVEIEGETKPALACAWITRHVYA